MAGPIPGFDPDGFRDAIRFAMTMGAPLDADQQATFYFPKTAVTTGVVDAQGVPYSPDTAVTKQSPKQPVKVACGVEDASGSADETSLGDFGDGIIITLLDTEYAQVVGFEYVAYKGVRYDFRRELPDAAALGPVGVHRLLCIGEGSR